MLNRAILKDRKVIPVEDLFEWAKWFESADKVVAQDRAGDLRVSTVFLGLNHGFGETPLWFETMVFRGESWDEEYCERYETWDEAVAGHVGALAKAKGAGE